MPKEVLAEDVELPLGDCMDVMPTMGRLYTGAADGVKQEILW